MGGHLMNKGDYKIFLFRFNPYVTIKAACPRQEVHCTKKRSLYPPVGLAQMAATFKKAGYEQVKMVDAWAEELNEKELLDIVERFDPHIVGCTLWTTNLDSELPILEKIKQRFPNVTTVTGGPHFDVYPRECLKHCDFIDFGVVGEAEESAVELLEALRTNSDSLGEIKGIVYREGKEVVFTGSRPPVNDLDTLPFPDFTGLPVNKYYAALEKFAPFIYIFSTRGCPYRCRYCHNSRGKGFRKHSVDYLIAYIKHLRQQYGLKEIVFFDDTFTFDKERTLHFCKLYKEEVKGTFYNIRTRADHVDDEILSALKESGCHRRGQFHDRLFGREQRNL
jgi:anaerobic magnesium-protoporphyrin IX monomethyl ester cyclase